MKRLVFLILLIGLGLSCFADDFDVIGVWDLTHIGYDLSIGRGGEERDIFVRYDPATSRLKNTWTFLPDNFGSIGDTDRKPFIWVEEGGSPEHGYLLTMGEDDTWRIRFCRITEEHYLIVMYWDYLKPPGISYITNIFLAEKQ